MVDNIINIYIIDLQFNSLEPSTHFVVIVIKTTILNLSIVNFFFLSLF